MRALFTAVFLVLSLLFSSSFADKVDLVDGNQIAEPNLPDYIQAERSPGLSEIYDVVE